MKEFFRDYGEYQKSAMALSKVWYKKHWKGTVVFTILYTIVCFVAIFGWTFRKDIKEIVVMKKAEKEIKVESN